MNITFIGGGNMASSLIGGLLKQGFAATQLRVAEISEEHRTRLQQTFSVSTTATLSAGFLADSNVIVLAVKPQQLVAVSHELAPLLGNRLVISIAAGIRTDDLSRWLQGHTRIVRAMPNTPALIGAAVTGLYAMPAVSPTEKQAASTILAATGSIVWLEREALLDAVTAISGSGPAYVFYYIEAMQQAALSLGLDAAQAKQLSLETFLGTAKLAAQSDEDVSTLRARVTSKGGTTERAIRHMENAGVGKTIIDAIHAAATRARELGDESGHQA